MISVRPKFKALTLSLRGSAGAVKMPLAQAHPFEPMPVTHEETLEVSPNFYSDVALIAHWLPAI